MEHCRWVKQICIRLDETKYSRMGQVKCWPRLSFTNFTWSILKYFVPDASQIRMYLTVAVFYNRFISLLQYYLSVLTGPHTVLV